MQWKDTEYDGYSVSSAGDVKGPTGRVLKPQIIAQKYLAIGIWLDNRVRMKTIHRLVAKAFLPNPDNKPEVDHIDWDTTNNNVNNLRWVTSSENVLHRCTVPGKSGQPLIYLQKTGGYQVIIKRGGKYIFNKTFKTLPDAVLARDAFLDSLVDGRPPDETDSC